VRGPFLKLAGTPRMRRGRRRRLHKAAVVLRGQAEDAGFQVMVENPPARRLTHAALAFRFANDLEHRLGDGLGIAGRNEQAGHLRDDGVAGPGRNRGDHGDTAYEQYHGPPRYCFSLSEHPQENEVPLLKLHGSFNWKARKIHGRKRTIELRLLPRSKPSRKLGTILYRIQIRRTPEII